MKDTYYEYRLQPTSSSLYDCHEAPWARYFGADIIACSAGGNEEEVVGHLGGYVLMAEHGGVEGVIDSADAVSGELHRAAHAAYNLDDGWVDLYLGDIYINMFYIETMYIEPEHRSKGAGKDILISFLGKVAYGCSGVFLRPIPLEKVEGRIGRADDPSLELKKRLVSFYKNTGFIEVEDTPFMLLNMDDVYKRTPNEEEEEGDQ